MNSTLATTIPWAANFDNVQVSEVFSLTYLFNATFSAGGSLCSLNTTAERGYAAYNGPSTDDFTFLFTSGKELSPRPGCNATTTNDSWYCNGFGGATCKFKPCIQTYIAYVEAGTLTEVLVEESDVNRDAWGISSRWEPLPGLGTEYLDSFSGLVDISRVTPELSMQMREAGYDLDVGGTTRWLGFNLTQSPATTLANGSLEKALFDNGALFVVDDVYLDGCLFLIEQALAGTSTLDQIFAYAETVSIESIGAVMANVAKAISFDMRSSGQKGFSEPASGIVYDYAVCVQVNWPWFTLPAILGASTVCILIYTIIDTAQNDLPVWKSFPLAILFNGPGMEWMDMTLMAEQSDTDLSNIGTQDGMEKLAKRVSVRLVKEENGHRLRHVMSGRR